MRIKTVEKALAIASAFFSYIRLTASRIFQNKGETVRGFSGQSDTLLTNPAVTSIITVEDVTEKVTEETFVYRGGNRYEQFIQYRSPCAGLSQSHGKGFEQ